MEKDIVHSAMLCAGRITDRVGRWRIQCRGGGGAKGDATVAG